MFSFAHGRLLCLFLCWLLPITKWRRINVSRWPFVLHERRGKCSFSTDLREPSCSSFQSSNYRQPSQTSTLQNTEIKQLFTQGSSWAQTRTFLLIPGKSLDHCLGWLVDSVRSRSFPAGWMILQSFQVHDSNIWSHFSTSLLGFWWREIFCPLRRGKELALSYDIYLLWKFITLFLSYQLMFLSLTVTTRHPLFLLMLVFIPLIWG